MRQIVLDTETTGLEPSQGHRLVELAGLELSNRRRTGAVFHRYLNPQREIDPGALEKHGLTPEFLADKPRFADVVDEFVEFVAGAELVIHNAAFDVSFLDREFALLGRAPVSKLCPSVVDTLRIAKGLHPGKRNSLDALCERYQIDNSRRVFHGALLDAELLAEVYLAMTRGQETLVMDVGIPRPTGAESGAARTRRPIPVIFAAADEAKAHDMVLDQIDKASKGACLWRKLATA